MIAASVLACERTKRRNALGVIPSMAATSFAASSCAIPASPFIACALHAACMQHEGGGLLIPARTLDITSMIFASGACAPSLRLPFVLHAQRIMLHAKFL